MTSNSYKCDRIFKEIHNICDMSEKLPQSLMPQHGFKSLLIHLTGIAKCYVTIMVF